ncbi:Uncharacterised protein [Streptococcus pneumoniae]|nr:Uncharacterised protein [Streptococcus pneumoniae]
MTMKILSATFFCKADKRRAYSKTASSLSEEQGPITKRIRSSSPEIISANSLSRLSLSLKASADNWVSALMTSISIS